ncbi:hypothetical protein PIB30_021841 [Stylosanthes scabra]|uniref:Uncharacterized protein n=1 Tax=Stylosanthes scabra TaxID=79078 RepID=A0ABU6YAZ0_9FABA|nr:hypothetical protein [Stylosanthes scabra]
MKVTSADVHTSAEQVNYVGNPPRNDPYSNSYNQGWKNHPNFSWGGNQGSNNRPYQPPFQRQQQYQPLTSAPQQPKPPQATSIEAALAQLTANTSSFIQSTHGRD